MSVSMSIIGLLVYLHILLMVFWLGTDLGVFFAGLRFMDPTRSITERRAVLDLGMVIDRFPRVCYIMMFPVGLQLTYSLGIMPSLSAGTIALAWAIGSVWLLIAFLGMSQHDRPVARVWHRIEQIFRLTAILVFSSVAIGIWVNRIVAPGWLAGKFLGYAGISFAAFLLERAFRPVATTFGEIAQDGSSAEREAILRNQMVLTYVWVLVIYAGVLVCGFLGAVKP